MRGASQPRSQPGRIVVARGRFLALVAGLAGTTSCASSHHATDTGPGNPVTLDSGVLLGPGGPTTTSTAACIDDDGLLPSCDDVNGPAEHSCDQASCAKILRQMKTRLASQAIDCMKAHITTGDSCQSCSADALASACPDPVAENACTQLRQKCPGHPFDDCLAIVSGLTFGGRLDFIACTTESDCREDVPSCLP